MNRRYIYILIGLLVIVGGFFVLNAYLYEEKQATVSLDYKDAEYIIDGKRVKLEDGISEIEAAPGSASKITTRYFGNEARKDINGDGTDDVIFLLTQETGGSGTFFYVVGAISTPEGYRGSEALLLGDRIAPQNTGISQNPNHKDVFVVNYAVRAEGEPFTAKPSIGKSIWLKLDPETLQFGEVAQDFPGEADPNRMTLDMQEWKWIKAQYNDGSEIVPIKKDAFKLTFTKEGTFSASTDCNGVGGEYTVNGNKITFERMMSTLMYCEGSQESDFAKLLTNSTSYFFTSKGELILELKFDSGTVTFR
jgi:heat shock protein HslJ